MPGGNFDSELNNALETIYCHLKIHCRQVFKFWLRRTFSFLSKTSCATEISYFSLRDYGEPLLQKRHILMALDWMKFRKIIRSHFPGKKLPLLRFEYDSLVDTDRVIILGHFIRSNQIYIYIRPHIADQFLEHGIEGVKRKLIKTILHELGHWNDMPAILTYLAPFIIRFYYASFGPLLYSIFLSIASPKNFGIYTFLAYAGIALFFAAAYFALTNIEFLETRADDFEKLEIADLGKDIASCLEIIAIRPAE